MENEQIEQRALEEQKYFVRVYRCLIDDYLVDKKLTFDEFVILMWLSFRANPHNGRVTSSYGAISTELSCKYTKNEINKICLELKKKKYIYFGCQQGRRSTFNIEIDNYPLANRSFKKIDNDLTNTIRGIDISEQSIVEEVIPEVSDNLQKSKTNENGLSNGFSFKRALIDCRSANNNKDNNKNNKLLRAEKIVDLPISLEDEQICKDIASDLGETDVESIISLKEEYGLLKIKKVFENIRPILCEENGLNNPKAYFISKLKKI